MSIEHCKLSSSSSAQPRRRALNSLLRHSEFGVRYSIFAFIAPSPAGAFFIPAATRPGTHAEACAYSSETTSLAFVAAGLDPASCSSLEHCKLSIEHCKLSGSLLPKCPGPRRRSFLSSLRPSKFGVRYSIFPPSSRGGPRRSQGRGRPPRAAKGARGPKRQGSQLQERNGDPRLCSRGA